MPDEHHVGAYTRSERTQDSRQFWRAGLIKKCLRAYLASGDAVPGLPAGGLNAAEERRLEGWEQSKQIDPERAKDHMF